MNKLLIAGLLALSAAAPGAAAPLTVEIDGVRSGTGLLYVSVQTREQFMQNRGVAGSVVTAPDAGLHRFRYDLPAGEYAVSVWHDDNGNGQFDKNENFIPLDGWAMVGGGELRGEPRFEQVRTVVGNGPVTVRMPMIYGR
jgi:uncharacterized protein (DUF2141 family)